MEGKELSFKHLPIAPQHLKQLPVEFKGRLVDQAEFQPIQSQFSSWFKHWQMGPQNHSKIPYYLHNDETTLSLSQIIFLYLLSTGISNTSLSTFHLQLTVKVLVSQSCLTLRDPMDCSPPGSSVHGICGLPFPSSRDLPDPGIEPGSPALQADSLTI